MLKKIVIITCLLILSASLLVANTQSFREDSIQSRKLFLKGIKLARNSHVAEAIDSFKASAAIRKRLFGENSIDVAIVNNALGINYKNLGDYNKAIEHFLLTEQFYIADYKKNELRIARLYNNIGNLYKNKMNYPSALDYYERAIEIYSHQPEIDHAGIADIYYNIANINYEQNKYNNVLSIIERYLPSAYPDTKLYFLSLKAAALQELGKTDKAYSCYKKTIDYAKSYYQESNINLVFEYLNFARFLIYTNSFDEARKVLENINELFQINGVKKGYNLALYYKTMGVFYQNLNIESQNIDKFRKQKSENLQKTIESYKKGLKALNFNYSAILSDSIPQISQNLSLTQTLEFLKLIADTYIQSANIFEHKKANHYEQSISKALDYYKITSEMIQQARREIYSDESKIQLNSLEEATFLKIIQTAFKAHQIKDDRAIAELAFINAERVKASSVFDRITDQMAKENSLIPDSLTELEKKLNFQITSNNEKLFNLNTSNNPDSTEIARTDSLLFHLKKQREELNQYLEKNFSDFYNLKYSNYAVKIADIQDKLEENEVLIEYVLNENGSIPELYSFFISPDSMRFVKHEVDSGFISGIEKMFRFMSNPAFLYTKNEDSKEYCKAAFHLYKKLILPFSGDIVDKKITIIPDGKLNYVSFEAMLEELPDTLSKIRFSNLSYLIKKNTINYAYSANLLFKEDNLPQKTQNRVLAFAPIYKADTVVFENEKLTLVPLPGIQREVELISKEIKTNLFTGKKASEINFRNHSSNYEILHLAMHAFINDSLPAFSRLAFSQNNNDSLPENDGWLNTADIYNLNLNARLTVLSACNTGTGILKKGEGIMSLARGFLYAGCPSIIMTKWEVEDNAGTDIMTTFYKNLKKGLLTDEALRRAKLEYLANANPRLAHPHYWMGYVSIGDPTPLFRSYDLYFFGLLILVLLVIAIDQSVRIKKARKKQKDYK